MRGLSEVRGWAIVWVVVCALCVPSVAQAKDEGSCATVANTSAKVWKHVGPAAHSESGQEAVVCLLA